MSIPRRLRSYLTRFNATESFWSFTKARSVREEIIDEVVDYHRVLEGFAQGDRLWDRDTQQLFATQVRPGSGDAWARELKTLFTLLGTAWVTAQNRIQLTDVGWELLQSSDPIKLLEHQVRKYQLGNPQLDPALVESIHTIPHYVLLKLLLNSYPSPIKKDEFILFVMRVQNNSEISKVWALLDTYRSLSDESREEFSDSVDKKLYEKLERVWSYAARFLTLPRYLEFAPGQVSIVDHDEAQRILVWYDQGHNTHIAFRSPKDWFSHYGGLATTPNPLLAADYYRKLGDTDEAISAYKEALRKGMAPLNDSAEDYRCRINGEAAIEDWLVEHLERIEPGLSLIERQYETSSAGRIDILARDIDDNYVVVELKRDMASDAALGQLLRYLGWVRLNLSDTDSIRGFVIGSDVDKHMGYAIQAHDVLTSLCNLRKYGDLGVRLKVKRAANDCRAWVEDLTVPKAKRQKRRRRRRRRSE